MDHPFILSSPTPRVPPLLPPDLPLSLASALRSPSSR